MTNRTAQPSIPSRPESWKFRAFAMTLILLLFASSGGCIWKLFSGGPPPEERIHDLYGTIQSITREQLVVVAKGGQEETFVITDATIKGSPDLGAGTFVHVYFKIDESVRQVTMVVEKR